MTKFNNSHAGGRSSEGSGFQRLVKISAAFTLVGSAIAIGGAVPASASTNGSGGTNVFMAWADAHSTSPHEGRAYARHGGFEALGGYVTGHSSAKATSLVNWDGAYRTDFRVR